MGSPQAFPNSSHEKQIDIPLKKEKRKTTGIPDPSKEKEERQEQSVELPSPQIKIEDLIEKKYYSIFCRFFSEDEEEGPNKAQGKASIKISTKELEKVLKRIEKSLSLKIDQKSQTKAFEPSKGKGSHAKGVIKNENKKVVITVPKHPYLLAYQIEQWKQSFIRLGYYPEYLKNALEEKKILNEKKSEFWKNKN